MGGSLVRDLPDPVDPEQIVEVDPSIGPVLGVEAELDRGSIAHLCHRDDPTDDARTGRWGPLLEVLGNQVFVRATLSVDLEDPGVFVKSLPELADIVVVKSVDVELRNSDDLVVVKAPRSI